MIVGLHGRAGVGKSTIAKFLVQHRDYKVVKFMGPMKDMLRAVGMTEDEIEGHLKEVPSPRWGGLSPRQVMLRLGQWGTDIHPEFWTDRWRERVADTKGDVVADDVRKPLEAAAVMEMGGFMFRVVRPDHADLVDPGHHTEKELPPAAFDWTVRNDGCVNRLLCNFVIGLVTVSQRIFGHVSRK